MAGKRIKYSLALAEEVCAKVADGEALKYISHQAGMPKESTIHEWLNKHEEFAELYARARLRRADRFADELIEIADTEEDAAKARNRIDVRKWSAAKLNPKVYGDRTIVQGTGEKDDAIHVDGSSAFEQFLGKLSSLASRSSEDGTS